MRRRLFYAAFILFIPSFLFADSFRVSGFVRDAESNEVLIRATVRQLHSMPGVNTDNQGYFSFILPIPVTITVSCVGYITDTLYVESAGDTLLHLKLHEGKMLKTLVVNAVEPVRFDVSRLSAKKLIQTPALGGKPDVLKSLQLLPGVQTHSEGLSLIMVRGGDPGQNQYLLDQVPLVYVNHLGGFMSVFNPDMINSVDFYKGSFPAKFSGKTSSIVDVTQREGNMSKHRGSLGIGLTDISLSSEGPLRNEKASYMITARKTLTDFLMKGLTLAMDGNDVIVGYGFHDVNAKLSWKPNKKHTLNFNMYQGDDYLSFRLNWRKVSSKQNERNFSRQQWGNWLLSANWKHAAESGWYFENILSFNRYRSVVESDYKNLISKFTLNSLDRTSVQDLSWRSRVNYKPLSFWDVELGARSSYLLHEPQLIYRSSDSIPQPRSLYRSFENDIYMENKFAILHNVELTAAMRLNSYFNDKLYLSPEPRLNLWVKLDDKHQVNLNYMVVSQNSHLVFTKSEILLKEVWLPATSEFMPQKSEQASVGWFNTYSSNKYSSELNFYYKKMGNLLSLKEGYENMIELTDLDNKVVSGGNGRAYGAELMLNKNQGRWTGSLGYGWSHATRQFEELDGGKEHEYVFNRPHSFSLTFNKELSKTWSFHAAGILQSGFLYTPAVGKQLVPDKYEHREMKMELIYGEKNSARMPVYHRLDLGVNYTTQTKRANRAVWTFSVYNIYNRLNSYNFYYDDDKRVDNEVDYKKPIGLYKTAFFPVIPSVSYKVYFNYLDKAEKVRRKSRVKPHKTKKERHWLYI